MLVIGAGASGAALVWSLAAAGINVMCLEQGDWLARDAFPATNADSQIHWLTDFHPGSQCAPFAGGLPGEQR